MKWRIPILLMLLFICVLILPAQTPQQKTSTLESRIVQLEAEIRSQRHTNQAFSILIDDLEHRLKKLEGPK
jgi:septal ring factor EnvC (AmiA/AmiB activator)